MSNVTELGQTAGMAWARSANSSFTASPLAELQEWQGGKKTPTPTPPPIFHGFNFEGPNRKVYAIGEKLSLDGLVVKAFWKHPDGNIKEVTVPEKIGRITDGYTMALDNGYSKIPFTSETIPSAPNEEIDLQLEVSYNGDTRWTHLRWMRPQPAITKITRPTDSFSPYWREAPEPPHEPELQLVDLPEVAVTLEDGTEMRGRIYQLIELAFPWLIFVETRYDSLEKTLVVTAKRDIRTAIKGIVEDHQINAYRYLYGNSQSTAIPVSEWLSITPPQR